MADSTLTREEREHKEKIAENYQKILDGASPATVEREYAPERTYPRYVATPAPTSSNAARIADYTAHPAPATKKVLFEDVTYRGQELIMRAPVAMPAAPVRPAVLPEMAPVRPAVLPETAPAAADEEDALPSRRTMETLNRAPEAETKKVGFFAALAPRTRTTLIALASCIVVFLVMIIVNAAILSSLDSQITAQEMENARLEQQQNDLQGEIDHLRDSDTIADWAQAHGMHNDMRN